MADTTGTPPATTDQKEDGNPSPAPEAGESDEVDVKPPPAADANPPPPPKPPSKGWERSVQLLTLLLGGGLGGIIGTVLSNTIEWRKVEYKAEFDNQGFVDKYLKDVANQDIGARIRIAEYFQYVLPDENHRSRWKTYLSEIEKKKKDLEEKYYADLKALEATGLTSIERERIQKRLTDIDKYFGDAPQIRISPVVSTEKLTSVAVAAPSDTAQRLAVCALNELGTVEDPKEGENRGGKIDGYNSAAGAPVGSPWTFSFISWCIKDLGLDSQLKVSAFGPQLWANAQKAGIAIAASEFHKTEDLRVGDIYFSGSPNSVGPAGIVTAVSVADKTFTGVEGNTNVDGAPGGVGVFKKLRRMGSINVGVVRFPDAKSK